MRPQLEEMGKIAPVPQWQWTVILLSVVSILIVVFVVRQAFVEHVALHP